jgi:hypothetical protein
MLKGVSTARLTLWNPPVPITSRNFASPAWAPSAAPTSCDSEVGTQKPSTLRNRSGRPGSDCLRAGFPHHARSRRLGSPLQPATVGGMRNCRHDTHDICPGRVTTASIHGSQSAPAMIYRGQGLVFAQTAPYVSATMAVDLFRRALVLLIAVAYLAVASPAPWACADTASMSSSAMQPMSGDTSNPAPCKGMDQGRCIEFCGSCFGSTSFPQLALLTTTAWSSIRYPHDARVMHGRIPAPLLGPPISRA